MTLAQDTETMARPIARKAEIPARRMRRILLADAASCLGAGALTLVGASFLAPIFGLPQALLAGAGAILLPVAALIAFVATREPIGRQGVRAIVAINMAWILASFGLLLVPGIAPTAPGAAFVIAQAALVAVFTGLEARLVRGAA